MIPQWEPHSPAHQWRGRLTLAVFCGFLSSVRSPSVATGVEDDVHSAVFVVTQAGLNNAPQLYSQFLADAITDANAEMRQPNYWCGVAD